MPLAAVRLKGAERAPSLGMVAAAVPADDAPATVQPRAPVAPVAPAADHGVAGGLRVLALAGRDVGMALRDVADAIREPSATTPQPPRRGHRTTRTADPVCWCTSTA